MPNPEIDLLIDFNSEDDTGLPWTLISEARDPSLIVPGRCVIAGAGSAVAVSRIVDVDENGVVHLFPIKGSVEDNRHLLDAQPSSA